MRRYFNLCWSCCSVQIATSFKRHSVDYKFLESLDIADISLWKLDPYLNLSTSVQSIWKYRNTKFLISKIAFLCRISILSESKAGKWSKIQSLCSLRGMNLWLWKNFTNCVRVHKLSFDYTFFYYSVISNSWQISLVFW